MKIVSRLRITVLCLISVSLLTSIQIQAQEDKEDFLQPRPAIPDDLIDDPHVREELGVNEFTAPSIKRIFDDLDNLAPLHADELAHEMPKRMPLNRADLAMEIGFLIAEGFIAVQAGHMQKIENLAKELSRYSRALGAGERVNRHAASLLENARDNNVEAPASVSIAMRPVCLKTPATTMSRHSKKSSPLLNVMSKPISFTYAMLIWLI